MLPCFEEMNQGGVPVAEREVAAGPLPGPDLELGEKGGRGREFLVRTDVRSDDQVATFSSRGPAWYDGIAKPDVVAPGFALVSNEADGSMLATTYPSLIVREGTSEYLCLNGSSMATGVVSGRR